MAHDAASIQSKLSVDETWRLVLDHPLYPLIQRLVAAIAHPSMGGAVFSDFSMPSKRELTKLIAQAQAPIYATISPTLLVFLTFNMRLVYYLRELSQRCFNAVMNFKRRVTNNMSTHRPMLKQFSDDEVMDDWEMQSDKSSKSKRSRLTRRSNEYMTAWFLAHKGNPYPTAKERTEIAKVTDLSEMQVRNWFANMRKRHWKPVNGNKKPRCLLDLVLRRTPN